MVDYKDGKIELKRELYRCKDCNKIYPVYLKEWDDILLECSKTGKLFYTSLGSSFPFSYLHKYFTNNYTIPWEKMNFAEMYHTFKLLLKKCQCEDDWIIIFLAGICPYCGHFDKEAKPTKKDTVTKDQEYIFLIEFMPLRSINDLPNSKLKKIFKDFNFEYWTRAEMNKKKNYEEGIARLKKHGYTK